MINNLTKNNNILKNYEYYIINNYNFFILNVNCISSNKINEFRINVTDNNNIKVIFFKKSILCRLFYLNNLDKIFNFNISGQLIIFFKNDLIKLINSINLFIKSSNNGNINLLYFNKILYCNDKISFISNLLSYKDTLIRFIYIIKYISIVKFFFILNDLKLLKINIK